MAVNNNTRSTVRDRIMKKLDEKQENFPQLYWPRNGYISLKIRVQESINATF